uniref:Uncharacterized protein n=1 Tax=Pavo cristatus TaxID=9049 RepID=A0A8C9F6Z8_PAVCR
MSEMTTWITFWEERGGLPESIAVTVMLALCSRSSGCCSTSSRSLLPLWKPLRSRAKWWLGLSW